MVSNKLEKKVMLYRNQFEYYCMQIFGDHRIERYSMDLDAIIFRLKYMEKHHKDLDKINDYKNEFIKTSTMMQKSFSEFLMNFLCDVIKIPNPFHIDDIKDIFAQNVKIDASYVTFDMIVISDNESYLMHIDNAIKDDSVYNMFPNEYFRFYTDSYNDGIAKAYPELFKDKHQEIVGTGDDADVFVHSLTFQTSEKCSLNCTYCYQFNKSPMKMTFETAKTFIDHLLNDDYGYINRYNSPAIIIEFIGGEPLLEINLTCKIYEYFLDKCYELNHPWFTLHRLSICSNGMQYFDEDVQSFFKEYSSQISFNISIDGNKELHDTCRIQPNGEGSYDIDMAALDHFNKHYTPERNSKMTLSPNNIKYLYDSVVDFINHGMRVININCVFEEGWTKETAKIEYEQLTQLADYILNNNLEHLYIAIFTEHQEWKQDKYQDSNSCGGLGAMLAIRPNGQFYPCLRYMPTSVGNNVKDLCIGTVQKGMIGREQNSKVLNMMDNITRRSQTNDICFECPLSNKCANCSALGHTIFGTPNKRTTFICIQMIAEHLANVYYWNLVGIKHPEWNLPVRKLVTPDEWNLLVVDKEELNYIKDLENYHILSKIDK